MILEFFWMLFQLMFWLIGFPFLFAGGIVFVGYLASIPEPYLPRGKARWPSRWGIG
jgi:hypothetical protein